MPGKHSTANGISRNHFLSFLSLRSVVQASWDCFCHFFGLPLCLVVPLVFGLPLCLVVPQFFSLIRFLAIVSISKIIDKHCIIVLHSISNAQHCLALALLSNSIAQHQNCLTLALLKIALMQVHLKSFQNANRLTQAFKTESLFSLVISWALFIS